LKNIFHAKPQRSEARKENRCAFASLRPLRETKMKDSITACQKKYNRDEWLFSNC
jgi:hypothetical protein